MGGVGSFIIFSQCSFLKFLFFSLTKSLVALDSLVAVWIVIQEKTAPVCPVPFQMRFPAPFKEFFLSFSSFTSDFALWEFEAVFIFHGWPRIWTISPTFSYQLHRNVWEWFLQCVRMIRGCTLQVQDANSSCSYTSCYTQNTKIQLHKKTQNIKTKKQK